MAELVAVPPLVMRLVTIIGATGGIGGALCDAYAGRGDTVLRLARRTDPPLELLSEPSIAAAAAWAASHGPLDLVIDATGVLSDDTRRPERAWRELDPAHMAWSYAINVIGPALLIKHFCPALPRTGRTVFAKLSARVGSIGDNKLGGWYSYRASKAALNQLVRTASIELRRHNRDAVCIALHPGTVATPLSSPFAKAGLDTRPAAQAAADLVAVIDGLTPEDTGGFRDHHGAVIPW